MFSFDTIKKVGNILREVDHMELYDDLISLIEKLISYQEENQKLKEEISNIEKIEMLNKKMHIGI